MADLQALIGDVGAFGEAVGCALAGFQSPALGLDVRTSVVVAPRQSGKSRSLAVVGLWRAFREREHRVLIVSAGEEASRRLLAEVRSIASRSPLLRGSVVDELAGLLTLTNGSEVRSVPASERQIRGWTVDTLLVDEAGLVSDELLLGAALPTTAARADARILLAGSANVAAGAFYDHATLGEAGSEHVRTFRWSLADCPWISASAIAAARESMSELRFRAEFEGIFAGSDDALFPRSVLDRVTVDYLPDRLDGMLGPARVLGGCDWGATRDRCAHVAIGRLARERVFAVRCAVAWPSGHPLHQVVGEIVASPAHYDALNSEANGIGEGCTQMLWRGILSRPFDAGGGVRRDPGLVMVNDGGEHAGDPFAPRRERPPRLPRPLGFVTERRRVVTSARMKAAVWSAIRLLVDQDRLLFSASSEALLRELLMLRVDLTASGVEKIEAGSGHDDLADSLGLAATPYKRRDGSWGCRLADLAELELRDRLPPARVPLAVATGEEVDGPGRRVLRRPAWASVRGPEVTLPAGVDLTDPTLRRVREAVGAAINNQQIGGRHG
jgi:hypothetical protein